MSVTNQSSNEQSDEHPENVSPSKHGEHYFYSYKSDNQRCGILIGYCTTYVFSVRYITDDPNSEGKVFFDPNTLSDNGTTSTAMSTSIGTHDGDFHADEALACFMLRQLPEYSNAPIVRYGSQVQ